eukprot:scaffold88551_cov47-Prasinocladus_malaysianus.AAC.1
MSGPKAKRGMRRARSGREGIRKGHTATRLPLLDPESNAAARVASNRKNLKQEENDEQLLILAT